MNQKWNAGFAKGMGRITINGVLVSPEHAWDTWLNGKYLHDDMNHMEELDRLIGIFREAHRAQFLEAAVVTINYTKWLYQNTAFFLHNDLLDLPTSSPAATIVEPDASLATQTRATVSADETANSREQ